MHVNGNSKIGLAAALFLDGVVILLAAAWLHSEFTGGSKLDVGPWTLSNRDANRVLLQGFLVLAVRLLLRQPPFWRLAAFARLTRTGSLPDWLRPRVLPALLGIIVLTRVVVAVAGVTGTIHAPSTGDRLRDEVMAKSKSAPIKRLSGRWDAGWYATIVLDGYQWVPNQADRPQNVAFFPGFPLAVGAAATVAEPALDRLGRRDWIGDDRANRTENIGAAVNLLCFCVGALVLWRLAQWELEPSEAFAAAVIAAAWPFAYFYNIGYTEGLYLLGVAGAFYAVRRGSWRAALVAGLVVGLTRQTGFLLSLPLAVMAVSDRSRVGWQYQHAVAAAAGPVLGVAAYSLFLLWRFDDPFAWVTAQQAWPASGRWEHMHTAASAVAYVQDNPYEFINLAAVLCALPFVWASRVLSPAYALFGGLSLVVPLVADVVPLGRMTTPIVSIFLALGRRVGAGPRLLIVASVLLVLQAVFAALFYGWRPLY